VSVDEGYQPDKSAMVWDEYPHGPRAQYVNWTSGAEPDADDAEFSDID